MQITVQKKYLILVEVSENIFRVFLIVVNFVFTFVEEKIEEVTENLNNFYKDTLEKVGRVFNFIRALFGFNIYKLNTLKIKSNLKSGDENNFNKNKNQEFLIYSNLLAPPYKNFK